MQSNPELASWVVQQDTRVSSLAPILLVMGLLGVGLVLAVVRSVLGLEERTTLLLGLPLVAVLVGAAAVLLFGRQGSISLTDGALHVQRVLPPSIILPLEGLTVESAGWTGRSRYLTDHRGGIQLLLESGDQRVWIGGAGRSLAQEAEEVEGPQRTANPHVILSEEDFGELRSRLAGR